MRNIALLTEYDGTNYSGWQIQKNQPTVQEEITKAITKITGERTVLTGSSRTDAGVHALGHVSNFLTKCSIPADRIPLALNSLLPGDISVLESGEVPLEFNSRFDCLSKTYLYIIYCSPTKPALERNYVCHSKKRLDMSSMSKAAEHFIGTHDFSGFMSAGSEVKTFERTIHSLTVEEKGKYVHITVNGDGFLHNMVRIIAGTLYYVGLGKISPEEIPDIISSRDRRRGGKTLPPQGLYLKKVFYPVNIFSCNRER